MVSLPSIPDKLYFKIGEVSELVGVKPYVLRYWESEFKEIAPVKSSANQRLYRKKDVELLLKIRQLLYRERYTINGAKKVLRKDPLSPEDFLKEGEQINFDLEPEGLELASGLIDFEVELKMLLKEIQESIKLVS